MTKPKLWSHTDIGNGRSDNEDCIYANASLGLLILADGMGGHNGGEVASQKAVFGVAEVLEERLESRDHPDRAALAELIASAIQMQNRNLFDQAAQDARLHGMGCTLVVVVISGNAAIVANVGDSRCYLYRPRSLIQITKDHSLAQAQIDSGIITDEEAAISPMKNVLMRAVGVSENVIPDFFDVGLLPGDYLMTCSDGMLQRFSPPQLEQLFATSLQAEDPARYLVDEAVEAGASDNVSVQVIAI